MKARKPTTPRRRAAAPTTLALITQGMRQAALAADLSEEPRALPVLEEVPPGHCLYRVDDARHEPHLHVGEWIVVDTSAREIVNGELFVMLQSRGPAVWQVKEDRNLNLVDHPKGTIAYWLCPLAKSAPGRVIHLADGPVLAATLARDIVGRVIGLIDPDARSTRQRLRAEHDKAERARVLAARRARLIEGGTP